MLELQLRSLWATSRMHVKREIVGKFKNVKRRISLDIIQQSPYDNIYHCCTQRTASQWFRSLFNDPAFYQYTGLLVRPYEQLGLRYAKLNQSFPKGVICAHLYISYPTYLSIQKPVNHKAFYILRDPRDTVVSWYFAAKYSHGLVGPMPKLRRDLEKLSFSDGLKYIIDRLEEFGSFEVQKSWMQTSEDEQNIKIFRYEDLARNHKSFLQKIFDYLKIAMPKEEFDALCERLSFKKRSDGRSQGEENIYSHNRKGMAEDWKNHFDSSTMNYFKKVTQDLDQVLGYVEE